MRVNLPVQCSAAEGGCFHTILLCWFECGGPTAELRKRSCDMAPPRAHSVVWKEGKKPSSLSLGGNKVEVSSNLFFSVKLGRV